MRTYAINNSVVLATRAIKKMAAQFIKLTLPGVGRAFKAGEETYFVGFAAKVSANGEYLSVPLMFGGETTDTDDVAVIVTSAQFERAMDVVALIGEENASLVLATDKKALVISAGTATYEMPYFTEDDKVKIGTPAELVDKQVEITCDTAAFQARIAAMRPYTKNYMELRAGSDGKIKLIGEVSSATIPFSEFVEVIKATYDATVLQKAEEELAAAKAAKASVNTETNEYASYGYSFPIGAKYAGLFAEPIYGKTAALELYKNGFKFKSNGTTLIGLCTEKSTTRRMGSHQLNNLATSSDAYDYVALITKEELKRVCTLLGLWEQDIAEKTAKDKKVIPTVKVEIFGGQLSLSMTDAQTYDVTAIVKDNKPDQHTSAPSVCFHKETFAKVLSSTTDEIIFLCFAISQKQVILYVRDGHYDDNHALVSTGNHVFAANMKAEMYDQMCAAVLAAPTADKTTAEKKNSKPSKKKAATPTKDEADE